MARMMLSLARQSHIAEIHVCYIVQQNEMRQVDATRLAQSSASAVGLANNL
jgi:hypothetical protein